VKERKSICHEQLWRGGKRPHHSHWKYSQWRTKVYERDNFTCVNCQNVGGYLEAHHIKSWAKYPKLRYNVQNGITLCEECHKIIHKKYPNGEVKIENGE